MITRLLRWYFNRPDPALKLQTPIQKFTGWDQQKQKSAAVRQRQREIDRRKVEAGKHEGADVVPMEQRRIR